MKKLFTLLTLLLCVASSAWADAETIYSMTAVTGPTGKIESGTTVDINATFVGGSAQAKNGKSAAADLVSNSDINLGGSGASFFHATLTSGTIAEGDIITLSASGTMYVSATSTKPSSSVTFPYTVPSGSDLIGKTDVYLWKHNVSRFSSFIITRPSADDVANPVIEQNGSSVSITCSTSDASIYYTTNGLDPLASGTKYNAAFTIDNSCTVRAIAIKGENASSIIIKDCYVSHPSALAVLCYGGGAVSGDVWTSTDGNYILTNNVEGRGIGYVNLAESQDGFKLNHTDNYTLQVGQEIKVTKIVVVGKSWLKGNADNAATLAFDGFTPASGTFFDFVDETYVKTIEFTPESELDYGATITMRPGKNQLGAWIEIYGVKRNGPADPTPVAGKTVTWDFSSETAQTAAGTITPNYSNTLTATDGSSIITYVAGDNDKYETSYLKPGGKSGTNSGIYTNRYFILNITKSGTISFVGANTSTKSGNYVILQGSSDDVADAVEKGTVANTASDCSYSVNVQDGNHVFVAFSSQIYTASLSWADNSENIALTTTSTMKGWRAFYDANNDYTLDANTKAYVATNVEAQGESDVVVLNEIDAVPAETAVLLKTTNETQEGYSMTLTKASNVPTPDIINKLKRAGAATNTQVYRLGANDDGVGFFAYTKEAAKPDVVVLDVDSSSAGARSLTIAFADDETTGIGLIDNGKLTTDNEAGAWYSIQGVRHDGKPSRSGLYIFNGKKVVIK